MNNNKLKLFFAALALTALAYSCKHKSDSAATDYTISPDAGANYKAGDKIDIKVHAPEGSKVDSVVYLLDSAKIASSKDTSGISLKTDTIGLGIRMITAKVYEAGKSNEVTTNILLLAAKAPARYTYKVEKVFPHDTAAYTEGLQYVDGILYESIGDYEHSAIRKVDLNTGKVLQETKLDKKYFGEGIAVVGDKVVQLTYKEKVGFVYDKNTLKLLNNFTNNVGPEGWGMCFDGNKLYMDDSTNRLWFLDKNSYRPIGHVDVCDDKQQIDSINELEYINGKIYANVYQTDSILVINPKTGAVEQIVDMKEIYPVASRPQDRDWNNNVLNGIAWDAKGQRLFVTGKRWPHLYQVKFVPVP
ncbi:glutaminyl-peptide cyclotransferase [Mucilaginibacter rubeus]|uniref:Glutaminyl-peptide cyclotransferase n=1 Tax=Mucilaginibacter rubeus TaxID=2027860 RepID=A0A5C1I7E1_9SPHI|nr:glutaminyl-peptide cyclotransferase [Mucilaginibacter rubeus]QEM13969.1 glutaminyl-peptide cyclotransferase [Mucilaginibacter rubeus]